MKTDFQNATPLYAEDLNNNFSETDSRLTATETVADDAIPAPVSPSEGDVLTYTSGSWAAAASTGYKYMQTVRYTSNGTFTKASYPGLKAVNIRLVGGGGGSQGMATYSAGAGGGGGGYAEKFVLASALSASETVTVGAGGTAGASGGGNGGNGGSSSFGTHCVAAGGQGITGGTGTTGDLLIQGQNGGSSARDKLYGSGGSSMFSAGHPANAGGAGDGGQGSAGRLYGGGASGGISGDFARSGNAGAAGIVIVDLFA